MRNIFRFSALVIMLGFLAGCLTTDGTVSLIYSIKKEKISESTNDNLNLESLDESIARNAPGLDELELVVKTSREFMNTGKTVKGSCWDYLNAVYVAAGFGLDKRLEVYKGKTEGPYCDPSQLLGGDWIMFNNLGYNSIGHSGLFVEWVDYESRTALVIDHPGLDRTSTGRYRIYDITELWGVLRPIAE